MKVVLGGGEGCYFFDVITSAFDCQLGSCKITQMRGQPLLLSDICLQWQPDVISDDTKLMYMSLTTCVRGTGIDSLRLSVSVI